MFRSCGASLTIWTFDVQFYYPSGFISQEYTILCVKKIQKYEILLDLSIPNMSENTFLNYMKCQT